MDSISSLFRVNMITTCSDSIQTLFNINLTLKNYDLITELDRVTFRDLSTNTAHPITQLRLRINSIEELKTRPDANTIQQQLQQDVYEESCRYQVADLAEMDETPWFERWKDKFLNANINYDHDFIGANFGVFIILSTKDLQTFDSVASKLLGQVRDDPLLRFMTNSFIEHYVVVNVTDSSCEQVSSQPNISQDSANLEQVPVEYQAQYSRFINCFGHNNCSWLNLAKDSPGLNIVPFLKRFVSGSLIPWCERQIRILNDAISTRKGLRRNLVIATRQLLNIGQTAYVNQSVFYTSDAGELKCRKLGDIAMCLGLYELASSSYDLAKKEFLNDSAWLYYAGACEAYSAAMFMLKKFQRHYIEKAVTTYLSPCKNMALATRATVLATDILKKTSPLDAAKFFITLTGNESDFQSALFLEQASICYTLSRIRLRKASFYYVLAGYRYSRCNLGNLSLKCYAQFRAPEWQAASEYVKLSSKHIVDQSAMTNTDRSNVSSVSVASPTTTVMGIEKPEVAHADAQ